MPSRSMMCKGSKRAWLAALLSLLLTASAVGTSPQEPPVVPLDGEARAEAIARSRANVAEATHYVAASELATRDQVWEAYSEVSGGYHWIREWAIREGVRQLRDAGDEDRDRSDVMGPLVEDYRAVAEADEEVQAAWRGLHPEATDELEAKAVVLRSLASRRNNVGADLAAVALLCDAEKALGEVLEVAGGRIWKWESVEGMVAEREVLVDRVRRELPPRAGLTREQHEQAERRAWAAVTALAAGDRDEFVSLFSPDAAARADRLYRRLTQGSSFPRLSRRERKEGRRRGLEGLSVVVWSREFEGEVAAQVTLDNVPVKPRAGGERAGGRVIWQWPVEVRHGEAVLVPPREDSLLPDEDAVVREAVGRWCRAVLSRDLEDLARLYDDPAEAAAWLREDIEEIDWKRIDVTGAEWDYEIRSDPAADDPIKFYVWVSPVRIVKRDRTVERDYQLEFEGILGKKKVSFEVPDDEGDR